MSFSKEPFSKIGIRRIKPRFDQVTDHAADIINNNQTSKSCLRTFDNFLTHAPKV